MRAFVSANRDAVLVHIENMAGAFERVTGVDSARVDDRGSPIAATVDRLTRPVRSFRRTRRLWFSLVEPAPFCA